MRIPGTRRLTASLNRTFEMTPADWRTLARGYRDVKATVTGVTTGALATGSFPFTNVKSAAVTIVTSSVTAMAGKYHRENTTEGEDAP